MKNQKLNNGQRLLTGREAAIYLGISTKTLWEWYNKGILPRVKMEGTKTKYDKTDLDELIEKNKQFNLSEKIIKNIIDKD